MPEQGKNEQNISPSVSLQPTTRGMMTGSAVVCPLSAGRSVRGLQQ
jgi:hypothetical protein